MAHRSESLKLYRDIMRATKIFTWRNAGGEQWGDVLRANARKEFEQARFERDPLIVVRLLFVGRDCLNQTVDKLRQASLAFEQNVNNTRTDKK